MKAATGGSLASLVEHSWPYLLSRRCPTASHLLSRLHPSSSHQEARHEHLEVGRERVQGDTFQERGVTAMETASATEISSGELEGSHMSRHVDHPGVEGSRLPPARHGDGAGDAHGDADSGGGKEEGCRLRRDLGRFLPRTLLLHGTGDGTVPFVQSSEVAAALEAIGVPTSTFFPDGGTLRPPVGIIHPYPLVLPSDPFLYFYGRAIGLSTISPGRALFSIAIHTYLCTYIHIYIYIYTYSVYTYIETDIVYYPPVESGMVDGASA